MRRVNGIPLTFINDAGAEVRENFDLEFKSFTLYGLLRLNEKLDGQTFASEEHLQCAIMANSIEAIIDSEGADLCGTAETVSFIGDRQRLTITGAADSPIVVEAPNSLAVEAGQRVGLGIEPCTVRLLPEDRR
jgi:hypothetical protein